MSRICSLDLEERRELLARFQLYDRLHFLCWVAIIRRLISSNVDSPLELSRYSYVEANRVALGLADPDRILTMRQAACIACTAESAGRSLIPFRQSGALVAQFRRVKNIDDARPAKRRSALIDSPELGNSFDRAGPVAKIHKVANPDHYRNSFRYRARMR